jgi:hypothetical protein
LIDEADGKCEEVILPVLRSHFYRLTLVDLGIAASEFITMGHISYVEIANTTDIGVTVMGIPRFAILPLHDHPNMTGFIYLIHGKANVYQMKETETGQVVLTNLETISGPRLV